MLSKFKIITLLFITACSAPKKDQNFNKLIAKSEYNAVMFIAPDCPLCKTLSKPYLDLRNKYPQVQFIAVHSGENYEAMEINMFATGTDFKAPIFRDYDYTVAHQLNASITPEFFIIDSTGNILYQGLLDDRIEKLGNLKQVWNHNYLDDALNSIVNGSGIAVEKTTPVGCVLEY
jgi:thioredoxin-related protein